MPMVQTFIQVVQPGEHAESLVDELRVRLTGRAQVGEYTFPEVVPVIFVNDPPAQEQRAACVAALNAIDRAHGRDEGDWQDHIAVTR